MPSKSLERKIDRVGRIVIPSDIRRDLDMPKGTRCVFRVNGNKIILERLGSVSQMAVNERPGEFDWKGICPHCSSELMKRFNRSCCGFCGKEVRWKNESEEDL